MFWITQESGRQKVFTSCLRVSVLLWWRFFWFLALVLCLLQGIKHSDHFGFICRDQLESGPSQYVCFVFQCASESLVSRTRLVKENNLILLFWAPPTSLCVVTFVHVRWMRWCLRWSRPSLQQQLCRATKQRSSYVKPAPFMTCTNSVSGLKVSLTRWTCLWHYPLTYWSMGFFRGTDRQKNLKMRWLFCPPLSPGLYPPRAKIAIQKYLSQLTDNEQAEIFERVQVLFAELRQNADPLLILVSVAYF